MTWAASKFIIPMFYFHLYYSQFLFSKCNDCYVLCHYNITIDYDNVLLIDDVLYLSQNDNFNLNIYSIYMDMEAE